MEMINSIGTLLLTKLGDGTTPHLMASTFMLIRVYFGPFAESRQFHSTLTDFNSIVRNMFPF